MPLSPLVSDQERGSGGIYYIKYQIFLSSKSQQKFTVLQFLVYLLSGSKQSIKADKHFSRLINQLAYFTCPQRTTEKLSDRHNKTQGKLI